MELDELREMSPEDLRVKERESREEVFRLKLKLRTNQLDNPAGYRRARRELARIKTVLRQKLLAAQPAARLPRSAMRQLIKQREGVVVAARMNKTVVVQVEPPGASMALYGKRVRKRRSRFMAHDERAECREGDRVLIIEARPLSKNKRWRVSRVMAQRPAR